MIKTTIYGIALGTFVLTSGANAISVQDKTSTSRSSHVANPNEQAINYPQGSPINSQRSPYPQGSPINSQRSPYPQGSPINSQRSPYPQGSPINSQRSPYPQGSPINSQRSPYPQGSPINSQRSPYPQGSPTNSQGSPTNSQGSPTNSQGSPSNSQGSPTNSQDSPSNSQGSQSSGDTASIEASVFQQINQYRASINLPALTRNSAADNQAKIHSQDMASGKAPFGHTGASQRFKATGIAYKSAAENVAYNTGSDPATKAVQGWLKSPGHLANIKGNFNLTGIGVAKSSDGKVYLTQIFLLS